MKKGTKPSRGRAVGSRAAQRPKPTASKATRKPKTKAVKPKRQPTPAKTKRAPAKPKRAPAKPKVRPAPVRARRKVVPVTTTGPSVAAFQRRIRGLEEQLQAREQDRVELARWRQYHSQLQDQIKAKDSALAFKEKELLDLRRQVEELKAELKKTAART